MADRNSTAGRPHLPTLCRRVHLMGINKDQVEGRVKEAALALLQPAKAMSPPLEPKVGTAMHGLPARSGGFMVLRRVLRHRFFRLQIRLFAIDRSLRSARLVHWSTCWEFRCNETACHCA